MLLLCLYKWITELRHHEVSPTYMHMEIHVKHSTVAALFLVLGIPPFSASAELCHTQSVSYLNAVTELPCGQEDFPCWGRNELQQTEVVNPSLIYLSEIFLQCALHCSVWVSSLPNSSD